jgi:hypothetical protein
LPILPPLSNGANGKKYFETFIKKEDGIMENTLNYTPRPWVDRERLTDAEKGLLAVEREMERQCGPECPKCHAQTRLVKNESGKKSWWCFEHWDDNGNRKPLFVR